MTKPEGTLQLPPQMSTLAPQVDFLYYVIFWVSVVFFVAIVGVMVWYTIRYRRRSGVKPQPTGHNTPLEIAWTFLPLLLLGYLFHEGFKGYVFGAVAPDEAIEIRVRGMQWNWEFEHPPGIIELNTLQVPVHEPIKLVMSSSDVLHSFFVPSLRIKRDVVPGMYTSMWFEATSLTSKEKPLTIFCTEYCGAPLGIDNSALPNTNHSTMLASLNVVTRKAYMKFLEEGPPMPAECDGNPNPAACWGEKLRVSAGCQSCHAVDGVTNAPGPNWKGLFGATRKFVDGKSQTADENYIATSIREPQSQIVSGYANVNMPPYRLSDKQIDAIIAYMRSLNGTSAPDK